MPDSRTPDQEPEPMKQTRVDRGARRAINCAGRMTWALAAALIAFGHGAVAEASGLSWLDNVVHDVILEAKAGSKGLIRGGDGARLELKRAGRLFATRDADETLEQLVRRSEELMPASRRFDRPAEALLSARFSRLMKHDAQTIRTFDGLKPAEKWLVVEMGETAQRLARRYPQQAEIMVRQLGPDGLTAVRVFGDDVAEVLAKEGADGLGVLRKAGRGGWAFFTRDVLPHKKKLAAAGVLALFLASPDKFADYAGRATEFAVREFARAGVQLAGAVGVGAARGLDASITETLAGYGLDHPWVRSVGIGLSGLVVVLSLLVIVGVPVRMIVRPLAWLFPQRVGRRPAASKKS